MGYKMKGSSFYGHGNSSPAKIAPLVAAVAPMIMDKMKKKKEDKSELVDEMSKKESPAKHWRTFGERTTQTEIDAVTKHNKDAPDHGKKKETTKDTSETKKEKSPGKFWATAAKIAIGANKKHQANKQARDDAKQAGIQSAYGNKKL